MRILFPIREFQKLRAYVMSTKYEISGLGKIELIGDELWVREVKIFKQIVGGAETTMDRRALGKFYDEMMQKGEDLSKWKLWWHSHCDMDAFFSGTDTKTIEDFDNEMPADNWMLSIVTNHNGKILPRVDIFQPIRCTIADIDWDINFESDPELESNILDEVTEKVEIHSFRREPFRPTNDIDLSGKPDPYTPFTGSRLPLITDPKATSTDPLDLSPFVGEEIEGKRIGES